MGRAGGITNAVNVGIAVQADWENRELISHISLNIRRLFDFLVQFGTNFPLFSFSDLISLTPSLKFYKDIGPLLIEHLLEISRCLNFLIDSYKCNLLLASWFDFWTQSCFPYSLNYMFWFSSSKYGRSSSQLRLVVLI